MRKHLYIVIDIENNSKHLSYHKSQKSAYHEVARLSHIPFTMKNSNRIGSSGGWRSEHGNFFVLEKDLLDNSFPFDPECE